MTPNTPEQYGLAAIGKAGQFTVEVLETSAASYLMAIEAGSWSLSFALSSEDDLKKILTHLRGNCKSSKLSAGLFLGAPVILIKDDEFSERYFLGASKDGHVLDVVLAADGLAQFTGAVARALDDLSN